MMIKLFALMLLIALPFAAIANPNLNQNQAIQVASTFCTAIGKTVTGTPTVTYLVPDRTGTLNPGREFMTYSQPVWRVAYNEAEVQVDAASGKIAFYYYDPHQVLSTQFGNQPAGQAVTQQAAISTAAAAIQAAGWTANLVFESATLQQGDSPPTASMHSWGLVWRRMYQGISFDDENVNVTVQAETGQLESLGAAFDIPDPVSTAVTFDRSQADAIANTQMANHGIQNAVLDEVDVRIVKPNNYWQVYGTNADYAEQPGVSRVAYVYFISVPTIDFADGSPSSDTYQVNIDAQNGAVIGGEFEQLMGLADVKRKAQTPVTTLLENAREARLFTQHLHGAWSKAPVAVLNHDSKHDYFRLLQHTMHCKDPGPLSLASIKIVVLGKGKARHELRYIPATGRIGSGREWGIVPDTFKAWVASLDAKTGKKKVASAATSPHGP